METDRSSDLTQRQRELLELVLQGVVKSKDLSRETGLSPASIDNALSLAAKKLGAPDRNSAAARFEDLRQNSHQPSHIRKLRFAERAKSGVSGFAKAVRRYAALIIGWLRGPSLGGSEHSLRWDQITLQVLRVAVIGMVTLTALVLFVLGFFRAFS